MRIGASCHGMKNRSFRLPTDSAWAVQTVEKDSNKRGLSAEQEAPTKDHEQAQRQV